MDTRSSQTIDELRAKYIGMECSNVTLSVGTMDIQRFAEAIDDTNFMWSDENQASETRYGGIIAPPTFLRSLRGQHPTPLKDLPYDRLLDGGSEWEYFHPVRPGDQITGVSIITDIYKRDGRTGHMLFIITETKYTNQSEDLVATQRSTSIKY